MTYPPRRRPTQREVDQALGLIPPRAEPAATPARRAERAAPEPSVTRLGARHGRMLCEHGVGDPTRQCDAAAVYLVYVACIADLPLAFCEAHLPWHCRDGAEQYEAFGRAAVPILREIQAQQQTRMVEPDYADAIRAAPALLDGAQS